MLVSCIIQVSAVTAVPQLEVTGSNPAFAHNFYVFLESQWNVLFLTKTRKIWTKIYGFLVSEFYSRITRFPTELKQMVLFQTIRKMYKDYNCPEETEKKFMR